MRRKVSVKIFFGLLGSFIIVLGISFKLNIDTQVDLYKSYLMASYNYDNRFNAIREKFPAKTSNNKIMNKSIIEESKTEKFEKDFYSLADGYLNTYIFYTMANQYDTDSINRNTILNSTFVDSNYSDNHIYYFGDNGGMQGLSIERLSTQQKESLREYINKQLSIEKEKDECWISYVETDGELKYLEWGDEHFGDPIGSIIRINILHYYILGEITTFDNLRNVYQKQDTEELKRVVEIYMKTYTNAESYVVAPIDIGDVTYFVMNTAYYHSLTEDSGESCFVVVNVNYDIRGFVFDLYFEQNAWLCVGAFVMAVILSWLFSYMISKPIRKVEKAALKIASQDFDEPLIVKSKDEIGSLAKSVDSMRVQLKETIENLQQEINKVKNLESLRKDFINQFTHEMKTPLGIINGYSELIEESKNEEEVNKYLNIINRETNRVNELIQSMLKLSRLEAKKVELNKQDIDLEESVVSIVDEYEVLLMKKNIKVEVNVVQSTINADKKLIETVIHNFLSNAIKHTDMNHKIIINIDNGVSIFNEGKPIDDDKIENIWYTFVTHDREGSGLGLAICRSILDLHEFKYGVNNKENGVCFWFKVNELFI